MKSCSVKDSWVAGFGQRNRLNAGLEGFGLAELTGQQAFCEFINHSMWRPVLGWASRKKT